MVDALSLKQYGAHTLQITDKGVVERTVRDQRGDRPWVVSYNPRETVPETAGDK